jgi:hypothetical protein
MKKLRNGLIVGLLLAAMASQVAYADSGDDGSKGGTAPEVPIALMLPAAAIAAVSFRAVINRRRR